MDGFKGKEYADPSRIPFVIEAAKEVCRVFSMSNSDMIETLRLELIRLEGGIPDPRLSSYRERFRARTNPAGSSIKI